MNIDVVGGVYHEFCSWPEHEALLGSAGRAALCLSQLNCSINVGLHSILELGDHSKVQEVFAFNRNCHLKIRESGFTTRFDYFHPLSEPKITPNKVDAKRPGFQVGSLNCDAVILFGMVDYIPIISGSVVIYDPQNTYSPILFSETNSSAERLVYIINRSELSTLFKKENETDEQIPDMAKWLQDKEQAEIVIVKCGERGAYILANEQDKWVSPYKTQSVFPIGSGDSFVAAFSYFWLVQGLNVFDATKMASVAAAYYVSHKTMNSAEGLEFFAQSLEPILDVKKQRVYLAGPFFTLSELWMVNEAKFHIEAFGMEVFSPYHEIGIGTAEEVVQKDIDAIHDCDAIYAIFNGTDPGTLFEVGYARSIDKPVVILAENPKDEELKMYEGSNCKIFQDFASSVYSLSWLSS